MAKRKRGTSVAHRLAMKHETTLAELERAHKVSPVLLNSVCDGKQATKQSTYERLAEIFGVTPDELKKEIIELRGDTDEQAFPKESPGLRGVSKRHRVRGADRSKRDRGSGDNADAVRVDPLQTGYTEMYYVRMERGYTATKVACAVGMSEPVLRSIEKNINVNKIKQEYKDRLSAFYRMPWEELFRIRYGERHPVRTTKMDKDELEKMLAEEYGGKLKPIRRTDDVDSAELGKSE